MSKVNLDQKIKHASPDVCRQALRLLAIVMGDEVKIKIAEALKLAQKYQPS